MTMTNKTRQIIVVVAVFVIALASLGTVIGLLVNTGQLSEYSDGFRYELNGSRATITSYEGNDTDVIVPDKLKGHKVVAIERDAFKDGADSIKSIKFNCKYSSFNIASETFYKLTKLEKVVLPSNLKEIPYAAFEECTSLNTVIIPNSLTLIGDRAFKDCANLKVIYSSENYSTEGSNAVKEGALYLPKSLVEIGANAFDGCKAITEAHMFKSLDKIGNRAFNECTGLTTLVLEEGNEITSIGDYAFYKTSLRSSSSTTILSFPKLVSIGEGAFKSISTTYFYTFELPASVKKIGNEAFADSSLNEIRMAPEIQPDTMGEGIFESCSSLRTVTVTGSTSNINTLPEGIKEIPAKTFMGCFRLLYNRDFEIGKNVESIGDGAFAIYVGMGDLSVHTYSKDYVLKVNEANENFKITLLKRNMRKKDSAGVEVESELHDQGLLTDIDGKIVYAYYGSYDGNSYFDNTDETLFKLVDRSDNPLLDITTIKAYAFAGVQFERIQLPNLIEEIGDYIFYDSDIEVCYTAALDWRLTYRSFNKEVKSDDVRNADVQVLLLKNIDGVDEFIAKLGGFGIKASTYNGGTLK